MVSVPVKAYAYISQYSIKNFDIALLLTFNHIS